MPDRHLDDNGFVIDPADDRPLHLHPNAVAGCTLCDPDGYRSTGVVCDHEDRTEAAARGHDLVQAELDKIRQRKTNRGEPEHGTEARHA